MKRLLLFLLPPVADRAGDRHPNADMAFWRAAQVTVTAMPSGWASVQISSNNATGQAVNGIAFLVGPTTSYTEVVANGQVYFGKDGPCDPGQSPVFKMGIAVDCR